MLARRLLMAGGASFILPSAHLAMLFNGSANGTLYAIGAATSTDAGTTWTVDGGNPVIQVGSGGSWEDATVKDPCLLLDGSTYVVYYAGYDGTNYSIGRATASAVGGAWTKYGSNPVLTKGTGGAFDDAGVRFPTVLHEPADTGKEWKLWYGADSAGHVGDGFGGVGYAYSTDGLSWTKVGQVLTKTSGWESDGVYPFAITKSGATYYLYYGGYPGGGYGWQGGVVTFTDPEGTYTRDGANPTQTYRKAVADTSIYPVTISSGSAVATLTPTSAFNVHEAVLLANGSDESEAHYIVSIDSFSQVTLDSPAVATFNAGNGGTFRSYAYNSVVPRSVLTGGGYSMYGTAFQTQEDLSPGGTKLREGSLRWTSASLAGAWAYDYTPAGLLIPQYPAVSNWQAYSSENPSVIVTP